ncbi:hypothetical protein HY994_03950 [Candidatus Micrarchaeota archaeon]|nr:hypothetical protein [Candidatus Micrarchaeota archaeon]
MMRQASLYAVHNSPHSERFETAFEALKQANDRDPRYRIPYENYHDERQINGETVHGRWNTMGTPGLSTNVDLTRHILIPFRRGLLRADVARELVKAIMKDKNNYFADGNRFKTDAKVEDVLAHLDAQRKSRKNHPGPIELIFGHYDDPARINRDNPQVHLVLTLLDAPADAKATRGESYVHARMSTPVSVHHLGKQSGGDIRSRQAFSIRDYPTGAIAAISTARRRLDGVIDAIRSKLPNWKSSPFEPSHHLQKDIHHYYNREESMT